MKKANNVLLYSAKKDIEKVLSDAYDVFVSCVLCKNKEQILALGKTLNEFYIRHTNKYKDAHILQYIGQMRALINLCAYFAATFVDVESKNAVNETKHGMLFMCSIKNHSYQYSYIKLSFPSITKKILNKFEQHGLIRKEKFGKILWYNITNKGKMLVS